MTESRSSPSIGPSVCPFVALAEDRDRRADTPDDGNRCYAERAPRRRDLAYQSEYCYSPEFARCSVFLAWAARNAAEPSSVTVAAQKAWSSGIAAPEGTPDAPAQAGDAEAESLPDPSPEGGLFGMTEPADGEEIKSTEEVDWVSASAWAAVPWDERAEAEAAELEELEAEELTLQELEAAEDDDEAEPHEEATQAPKVPAALPLRKRKAPQEPIRSRGSGEWVYADPPAREPLVSRRYGVTPPILLAVLGILLVSIVVFLIATQIGGGDGDLPVAAASSSPQTTFAAAPTAAPAQTAAPSEEPQPTDPPRPRFYRVKSGDSLSSIAARFDVKPNHLQCLNGILDKNIVVLGSRLEIPPDGFSCPQGWRNATPAP
ncbi:MAG: LysM domain-containing protein [Candidatus Limnocylindrales bacterium]